MDLGQLHREVNYKAVASSGPGGQHANKVATKVLLEWDAGKSIAFTDVEHERVLLKLQNRLTKDGILQLSCQDSRSQSSNKELVFKRFIGLLNGALVVQKLRKKRTTPKFVKRKRLNDKKKHSEKKESRRFKY
ncbi:alternative ribosome rescue aminoacyl-tRNA hydrolase ArfB [Nonlabens ulvanivorans]|uniref:alternative ribosome rescue aminoacyl-tRNA hydrolase ArfB n=1 Tax=Nonlabens ulvanivorans TaxID=906888 RepID=UPI0037C6AD03